MCMYTDDYFQISFPNFINDREMFEKSEGPLTRFCVYVLVDNFDTSKSLGFTLPAFPLV